MAFVNQAKESKTGGLVEKLPAWTTLAFLAVTCLSIIYVLYRVATGKDPLEGVARKAQVLVGIADDTKKMVTA